MTYLEMAEEIEKGRKKHPPGVMLQIPKGKFPKGFPQGELLNEQQNGDRTYLFNCDKLSQWLNREVKRAVGKGND